MKSLQNININPANTIFIIVDMENEFLKPGGFFYTPDKASYAPGVITAVRSLSESARAAGIPIIYIQSVRTLKEAEFTIFGRQPHLRINTWATEIVDELKPQPGDTIVQKFSHDPFLRPDLDRVLAKRVPDPTNCQAVVTGGSVNVCVYHTAMGLYLRDYWTIVPVDCVYHSAGTTKEAAFEQFSLGGYPSIFLTRSDLVKVSKAPVAGRPALKPGT